MQTLRNSFRFICSNLQVHYFPKNKFFLIHFLNKNKKQMFYLKSKLNQEYVLALPDWQLLCQVSENAILDPITCLCFKNSSIFTS